MAWVDIEDGDLVSSVQAKLNAAGAKAETALQESDLSPITIDAPYVGVGVETPDAPLHVRGEPAVTANTAYSTHVIATIAQADADYADASIRSSYSLVKQQGAYDLGTLSGVYIQVRNEQTGGEITHQIGGAFRTYNDGTGNIDQTYSVYADFDQSGAGHVNDAYCFYSNGLTVSSGTVGTLYGIGITGMQSVSAATNAYGGAFVIPTGAANNNIGLLVGNAPTGPVSTGLYVTGGAQINNGLTLGSGTLVINGGVTFASGGSFNGNIQTEDKLTTLGVLDVRGDVVLKNSTIYNQTADIKIYNKAGTSYLNWFSINSSGVENVVDLVNLGQVNAQTIIANELPTSDPEVAGQFWNDAGTVKVSAG
jgi:hypothetical protein